jgi:hypothetical protein
MKWSRPLLSPGTDDWNEQAGRNILAAEDRRIRALFPEFHRIVALPGEAIWEGPLQPFAQIYWVRICWRLSVRGSAMRSRYASPTVFVLDPPLTRRPQDPETRIPHLYRQPAANRPAQLCLYWPDGIQFNAGMYLGDSILRWASEWLGFYELWQVTGVWTGPEAPHLVDDPIERDPEPERVQTRPNRRLRSESLLTAHPYLMATRHPVGESSQPNVVAA